MARRPRFDLPHIPQHVVQRGNNRLPCFLDDSDRLRYLQLLHEALLHTSCQLHAYVLMEAIRTYLQQQRALGQDAFKAMVEAKIQRFAGIRPAHRPRCK